MFHAGANPEFFKGTVVESAVDKCLGGIRELDCN
jgi:hypothetical protein